MNNKPSAKSNPKTDIYNFIYKSVVDLSEIMSSNSETQKTIQVTIFAVTGAVGGVLCYLHVKDDNVKDDNVKDDNVKEN